MRAVVLAVVMVVMPGAFGCTGDLDPPWQLAHARIVAVRGTPPAIESGARADVDALVSDVEGVTSEQPPELATVISPTSLASALSTEGGRWIVTAPDEPALEAARIELGLPPGVPVPLRVGVAYGGQTLAALKTVWLGMTAENPTLSELTIDGAPLDALSEIVVPKLVDVRFSIAAFEDDDINWLTSVGDMHDFDLPQSYLRVEADADPLVGSFAVVRRDIAGGVAWRVWPIRVE